MTPFLTAFLTDRPRLLMPETAFDAALRMDDDEDELEDKDFWLVLEH